MATLTTICVGRVGDARDSDVDSVTNEVFTSIFDVPVKLAFRKLVAASTNVEPSGGGAPFTEGAGDDYVMDNANGTITVLSTGAMADATEYEVDYDYNDDNLAFKVNALTTAASGLGKDYWVQTTQCGRMGVAVVVVET
jgi:hypothetical protein